ncbi:cadherin-like domain-containing protein [Pontiella sp.]|uniref:cadherin-like domain-containing protein n=1 Tax=Pontiella sp. TaxID=2837462 RepID=UPI003568B7E1
MNKTAWLAALAAGLVGAANAEVIYVDFYDNGTVNSAPESYNVLHTGEANGPNHPLASTSAGLSMTGLVDTSGASTPVAIKLSSYNNDGATAAGGGSIAIAEISGIATNASQDAFYCNDKGTAGSDFGFVVTFSNLTGSAYNVSLLSATTSGSGTWSVTTGSGDASIQSYASAAATTGTLDWTSVFPVDGTIQLTSLNTNPNSWKNVWIAFASLEAVAVVGNPPSADAISTNVTEDGSVDITLSGTDPEGDDLTYHILSMPVNGTLATNGALPDVTYTPNADYVGSDSFTYLVNDGTFDSAAATVSITVDPGNDDVPVADDLEVVVLEDSSVEITLSGSDIEGSNLTYAVASGPSNGSLSAGTGQVLTYTPNADFFGADSFTYTVNDGAQDSAPATVSITVVEATDGELILNGDFEADGLVGTVNNIVGPITGWNDGANLRVDTVDAKLPAVPTTAVRLTDGAKAFQNFTTTWNAASTFTVSFNACNVWWKSTDGTCSLDVEMQSATGAVYLAETAAVAGTHANTTYADWTEAMTWSFTFTGEDLIAAGASANEELRLNFTSTSINWLDNVSVIVEGGAPTAVGDISIEVVSGGTEVALSWATESGWNYGVEARSGLAHGSWDTIVTNGVPGNGGEVTITTPASAGAVFYRAYLDNE